MNCDIVELSKNITNFCDIDVMGIIVRTPCAFDCLKSISYCQQTIVFSRL